MAKQSALPLLLVAGVAAVAMKKKKKKKKPSETTDETHEAAPNWSQIYDPRVVIEGGGESGKMILDSECVQFAEKLNYDAHNQYITGMFHTLVEGGTKDANAITMAILRDQAPNCPWDNHAKWTELMSGIHEQLSAAVGEYAANFS